MYGLDGQTTKRKGDLNLALSPHVDCALAQEEAPIQTNIYRWAMRARFERTDMTKTYAALQAEIAKLQKQAEEARKRENADAIAEVRALMKARGISLADLTGIENSVAKVQRIPAKVQFKDPATGATWSGRGRTPIWLVEAEATGKSRESFRIS